MSLLETCASVAIISAVVFFAAPSLIRARENYQLDLTARQVAGKMAWTRIKAISRSRNCRLRLISNVSYVIECGNSATAGTITIWDRRMNSRRVVVNFTGRINVG